MPETVTCTECGAKLKVPAMPPAGKKLRCPKCQEVFTPARPDDEEDEREEPKPKRRDDDDDDEDDRPRKKKGGGRRRAAGAFEFDGSAGDFFVVYLLAGLLYMFTLGLGGPWAMCMVKKWESEHTLVNGRRLTFNGSGSALLGLYIVTMLLAIVTLGIYLFWGIPKIVGWMVENTDFMDGE